MSDYGEGNEATWTDDEFHLRGRVPKPDAPKKSGKIHEELAVRLGDIRGNSTGVYFALNAFTKGTHRGVVMVKHSTRCGTFVCLTCNTNDLCPHARFVKKWVRENPEYVIAETFERPAFKKNAA